MSAYDRQASPHEQAPAPDHLRPATKAWPSAVLADYQLELHQLRVLQLAAEAWETARNRRARSVGGTRSGVDADGPEPPSDADPLRAAEWRCSWAMRVALEAAAAKRNYSLTASVGEAVVK